MSTSKKQNGAVDIAAMVYGKVPPQAKNLEIAVLGAILLEKGAMGEVAHLLKPDIFYVDAHQRIYEVMALMEQRANPIDIETVVEELRQKQWLDQVGGPYYITKLTNSVVSGANIVAHAAYLLQKWHLRSLIKSAQDALALAFQDGADPSVISDDIETALLEIDNHLHGGKESNYTDLVFTRASQIRNNDGSKPVGIPSGYGSLDKIIICFVPIFYVIAARPGVGKTSFLVALMDNMTKGTRYYPGVPVGFFELESTEPEFIDRHIALKSSLDTNLLKRGGLDEQQKETVIGAAQEILNQNIISDFTPKLTVARMRSKARVWKKKYNIKALFIDYLQIVQAAEADEKKMRELQVGNIATDLQALAKELQIPVIAFAQLSRAVLNRPDKRPNMGDLRESGTIEAAARCVMFIHRPEYYANGEILQDDFGVPLPKGYTEIIVEKNNGGSKGTAVLIMKPHTSQFFDPEDIQRDMPGSSNWQPDAKEEDMPF